MARQQWRHAVATLSVACAAAVVAVAAAEGPRNSTAATPGAPAPEMGLARPGNNDGKAYQHVWPPMEFGWRVVVGSLIGFFGAACGSVGGVGGGGIFVPMLALIIGFDPKSSTAISKCMIMGGSVSTVYYNLKLKHPSLDMPLIDYDLALLMQPMLMLGVSIGVIFNVIFPNWLITALLITIFLVTSIKAYLKGFETWKKETIKKREDAKTQEQICNEPEHATTIPIESDATANKAKTTSDEATSILKNIYWKEFGLLAFVWVAFLGLQVTKNYVASCSVWYWVLNSLQIPVAVGVTVYEAYGLRTGKRVLSSKGTQQQSTLRIRQLLVYCLFGILAGLIGGLLGMGGGFIMGPLFLELGIPPQVSSATATFTMMFSSSMSVVEYYLLHRFPVPYAAYFTGVAFVAAITGQHCVRKLIAWLGRASLIIFILASMIFVSALTLGGVGISNIVHRMERHQYMGFESLCKA
ncbi:sulfite exporter TauE/SafE family protein 3-like [Miscanthus floridulus]|uniref:sulfite exporter TauE/SafE family protein 3-like n=1 Tax=Miscanthus floridulus TaxID=154761 RepID=UPI0034591590